MKFLVKCIETEDYFLAPGLGMTCDSEKAYVYDSETCGDYVEEVVREGEFGVAYEKVLVE